jgi:hypothetical protein
MAINEACKEAVWLKDQMFHERTKHIDIKYHYVRDAVARGKLQDIVEVHATRNLSQGEVCYMLIQILQSKGQLLTSGARPVAGGLGRVERGAGGRQPPAVWIIATAHIYSL